MDEGNGTSFSQADLERLLEISQSLVVVADTTGRILRLSDSWHTLMGWPLEGFLGHHFLEFLHPDDVEATSARFAARAAGHGGSEPTLNRYRGPDSIGYRWLRWDVRADVDSGLIWAVAHDVTEQQARAHQQELVADLGRQALEGAGFAELLETALECLTQGLSLPLASVLKLTGDGRLELLAARGLPPDGTVPVVVPDDESTVAGRALLSGQAEDDVALAVPIGRTDSPWGALTCADVRPRAFDEAERRFLEQVAHVLGTALERQQVEDRLRHQATHDSLTGLPNRELLRERMNSTLRQADLAGQATGLLLCDLDGFKDINDSLGHVAGDVVLQQLAQRLLATVGRGDTVARLGGDEFAICVVGPSTELEVLGMADAVIQAMRQPFSLPGLDVPLSTSIGVAVSPTHGHDASTLLKHADVAMYRAKAEQLGWALYDASLDAAGSERLVLTADLRAAIAADTLQLHYQPIVDLETGWLHSVEALCRWQHEQRGQVPPATFIPLAERTGLVLALTEWVVRAAAAQVHHWRGAGHDLMCSVNLSMAAVVDPKASAALIARLIACAPLLTVEITESWLVDVRGKAVIAELAAGGVRLSIDDFGTGYSSLASLRSFPVQQLKLDRQFVRDLDDERGTEVLRAVAQLGSSLGMDVIAEGVEVRQTSDRLRAAGLRLGQGFLWSPALPAKELDAWLSDH